jgi:hypothetical protein
MPKARNPLWLALALLLLLEGIVLYRMQGPAAVGADAPLEEFSAARALDMLRKILGDESPHPAGSLANDQVRERLVAQLRELGLTVQKHPCTILTARRSSLCNVLARLPDSSAAGQPLVLATHYDSVDAGPGAADAGSCVATLLETARALQHGEPLSRPVYLLFTDGEEKGLLGAASFVKEHSLSGEKPFVLNFEARGSSGPSLMYETHGGNLATIAWLSRCLPSPCFTSSAYVTVYRTMPNDTDFSAFAKAGWTGLNFAFIQHAHNYHTAQDTLANLNPRSVQHHGENALQIARRVAGSAEIPLRASDEDAVFFDLMSTFVVYFPERFALPIAGVALLVLIVYLWRFSGCREGLPTLILTALAIAMAFGLAVLGGEGVSSCYEACGWLPRRHMEYGPWLSVANWPLALAALALATWCMSRRGTREQVWISLSCISALAGVLVAWKLPGFSYLWLVPTCATVLVVFMPISWQVKFLISVCATGVVLLPVGTILPIVFGARAGMQLCPVCVFVLLPLMPCFVGADRRKLTTTSPATEPEEK